MDMERGMLRSHACTTTTIIRLLRTRKKVLKVNDCTQTDHPELLLHHSPKVLQLGNDLLLCQLFPILDSIIEYQGRKRSGNKGKIKREEDEEKDPPA
jgi:hypothetical protein